MANGGTGASTTVGALNGIGAEAAWFPGYVTGQSVWYMPPFQTVQNGSALLAGRAHCTSFVNLAPVTINQIGFVVGTASSVSGATAEMAWYANAVLGGANRPSGPALVYTTAISVTTAGALASTISPTTYALPAGLYWSCVTSSETLNPTVHFVAPTNASGSAVSLIGTKTIGNTISAYTQASLDIYTSGITYNSSSPGSTWPTFSAGTAWTENNNGSSGGAIPLYRVN